MPKDIRLETRIRNNLLLKKMEAHGISTVVELAHQMREKVPGAAPTLTQLGRLINMQVPARKLIMGGEWRKVVIDLSTFFNCLPEDLFSEVQQRQAVKKKRVVAELAFADLQALAYDEKREELDILCDENNLKVTVAKVLLTLRPREERVLRLLFGINEDAPLTIDQIGVQFGITGSRVSQIALKAVRKLKHPSRSRLLRVFLQE